ncbi:MAG: DUF2232 domain-containing protein [Hyphomicrobium sp.]|jgi:hypothetical protein
MTRNNLLAGLGLGLVAAVVFASATTGPLLVRYILFFITSLPIALAGLGWGWMTAAIAGCLGFGIIAIAAGPTVALAFAMTQAAPVVILTYLSLLSRAAIQPPGQASLSEADAVEYYPPGRLIVWAAALAGALSFATLLIIGGDLEELRKALGELIEKTIRGSLPDTAGQSLSNEEIKSLTDTALALLPAATAISWMGSLLFNLWLAGRVTLASGQLARPWPDLAAIEFPRGTGLVLGVALLGMSLTDYWAMAAASFAGTFFLAYVLLGLAIIHYTTRSRPWRPFALWVLYFCLIFVTGFGVLIALLGLADAFVHLRARFAPPVTPST